MTTFGHLLSLWPGFGAPKRKRYVTPGKSRAVFFGTGWTGSEPIDFDFAESWIKDVEGNRVDVSEHGWPI